MSSKCTLAFADIKGLYEKNKQLTDQLAKCNAQYSKLADNGDATNFCNADGSKATATTTGSSSTLDIAKQIEINITKITDCLPTDQAEIDKTKRLSNLIGTKYTDLQKTQHDLDRRLAEITDDKDTSPYNQSIQSVQDSVYASLFLAGIISGLLVCSVVMQI